MDSDTGLQVVDSLEANTVSSVLLKNGAALIRFPDASFDNFTQLSDSIMTPIVHHATATIERDPVANDPRTSTVNKGMDAIPLHREASYAPGCPDILMLYCERPADEGGETILCDGAVLLKRLPENIRSFVEDLDLHWSWEAIPERWKQAFGVSSQGEAEAALVRIRGSLKPYESLDFKFEQGVLHGEFKTKCVVPSLSEVPSFCNSLMIHAYREGSAYYARHHFRVRLPDGNPFPSDILAQIRKVADEVSVNISWSPGEMVVFDNRRFMHGRREFADRERRILIRMGNFSRLQ